MGIEALISFLDQFTVELASTDARFVTGYQQNRPPPRIKGKSNSPLAVGSAETQLFHLWMTASVQRVYPGSAELWSDLLQKNCQRQNLRLHVPVQQIELRLELIADLDDPFHLYNMSLNT